MTAPPQGANAEAGGRNLANIHVVKLLQKSLEGHPEVALALPARLADGSHLP
jgi:hypothetical protein